MVDILKFNILESTNFRKRLKGLSEIWHMVSTSHM